MSDDRAQTITRLAEATAQVISPYLHDGTFEASLTRISSLFTPEQAAASAAKKRAETEASLEVIIDHVYNSIAAHTLREAASDYRTTLLGLRHNGANIEQQPADWMEDRALDLERTQARRG